MAISHKVCSRCSKPVSIQAVPPISGTEGTYKLGLEGLSVGCVRHRPVMVPYAVGSYITAAYWFTASTSFANPAVTIARSLSDTFAGIHPADAPGFIVAEVVGAAAAVWLMRWMLAES